MMIVKTKGKIAILGSLVFVLAAIPFVIIAVMLLMKSDDPRIRLMPDMASQPKFKAQSLNPFFPDRRAMRPRIAGTVARGEWYANPIVHDGTLAGEWALTSPETVTEDFIQRGQKTYTIYCAPCHGSTGNGDGIVSQRAEQLREGTWTPPSSLHRETVKQQPPGQIFYTISNGIREMPAYGLQIVPYDRWAIVAYAQALQRNPSAAANNAPPENSGALQN